MVEQAIAGTQAGRTAKLDFPPWRCPEWRERHTVAGLPPCRKLHTVSKSTPCAGNGTLCRNCRKRSRLLEAVETDQPIRLGPAEPRQTDRSHWDQTVSL